MRFDPERSLARLDAALARVERLVLLPERVLFRAHPAVSGWTLAQHLFHVSLANELSLKNALALADRSGALIRPCGAPRPEAEDVLRRGRIPRGVAQAPRFVRPPPNLTVATLRDFAAASRRASELVRPRVHELAAAPGCIPHQLLGDLDACTWLRFARLHTAHHLRILRELPLA